MKLGAHVSTAGGLGKAIDRAEDIGAETVQIFASSPRDGPSSRSRKTRYWPFEKSARRLEWAGVLHGIYLVNVGGAPDLVRSRWSR